MDREIQGTYDGRGFTGEAIVLDGSSFKNCTFTNCQMTFCGGELPKLSGCSFEGCNWQFGKDAANTIAFLSGMYNGGFDTLIEGVFHEVRKGVMINQVDAPGDSEEPKPGQKKSLLKPLRIFRIPK